MIRLRQMTMQDVSLGMRLKTLAGWNQTADDWQRFLTLEPDGCFVSEWDGQVVGTTTTCIFQTIGWIAMVLVDPEFRGRGIGTRLMQHALSYMDNAGVKTARLDATPLGRPVYEQLGFVSEYELIRLEGDGTTAVHASHSRNKWPPEDVRTTADGSADCCAEACWAGAWDLDRRVTGTRRKRLLEGIRRASPDGCRMVTEADSVSGYVLTRKGSRATQIGPCITTDPESGRWLCDWALGQVGERPVFVDIPLDNRPAIAWAMERGFQEQRRLTRMCRGPAVVDRPECIWTSSGPEMG